MISTINAVAVTAMILGCAEVAMNNAIKNAAAKDHGWRAADINVSALEPLNRNGCTFFSATNSAQIGRMPVEYAMLPDGKLLRGGAAASLLKACGKDAPAEWWAQVITRFSGEVVGVVVDPQNAPSALRKMRAAGVEWTPPVLMTAGGTTSIKFYTIDYERAQPYEVKASLTSAGALNVETRKLLPKPRLVK